MLLSKSCWSSLFMLMKLSLTSSSCWLTVVAFTLASFSSAHAGSGKVTQAVAPAAIDWKDHTITPVVNPAYFDDPIIRTELRPTFGYQRIDDGFYTQGGDAWALAVHVSIALNDRLAFIINRGGYLSVSPKVGNESSGWFDLSGGLKYALIDDKANDFILTAGASFELPTGSDDILQGDKSSEFNLFTSAEKGFGDLHVTGNIGLRIPVDGDVRSTILGYNLQADYFVCRWFQPFVVGSAWTVVSDGR